MSIYLLGLLFSEKLKHEIKFIEEVNKRFGAKHALKLPAHITLHKPFKLRKKKEIFKDSKIILLRAAAF